MASIKHAQNATFNLEIMLTPKTNDLLISTILSTIKTTYACARDRVTKFEFLKLQDFYQTASLLASLPAVLP